MVGVFCGGGYDAGEEFEGSVHQAGMAGDVLGKSRGREGWWWIMFGGKGFGDGVGGVGGGERRCGGVGGGGVRVRGESVVKKRGWTVLSDEGSNDRHAVNTME